jgi:hypothetical protein
MTAGPEIGQHRALHRRQRMEVGAALFLSILEMIELPEDFPAVP